MTKRSVSIRGHSTSFSLEEEFWVELKAIAAKRSVSIAKLVTEVDGKRDESENLSSALRLLILRELKTTRNDM